MSLTFNKRESGINLIKGSSVSMEKDGHKLSYVSFGINWGAIKRKSFFGLIQSSENVDLDASVSMFSLEKKHLDTIYYGNLQSFDDAIRHSGDDRKGDEGKDDEQDNEIIEMNLRKISPEVHTLVFYLNCYNGKDFSNIPYSKIRIYEGTRQAIQSVLATYNLSSMPEFKGYVSMIMGKLVRTADNWKFLAIGEPCPTKKIKDTINYIQQNYL